MKLADPQAAVVLGWLATFLVHSTLWIAGAWIVARFVDSALWRERLWKGALAGGLVTTLLVSSLATPGVAWRWERPAVAVVPGEVSSGRPIVVQGAGKRESGARTPAPVAAAPAVALEAQEPAATNARSWLSRVRIETALIGLWLLGAAVALARLALAHARLGRALRGRERVTRGPLADALKTLAKRAGLRRRPRLSLSRALTSPIALAGGEIVVPARALERLAPGELETLLAHELAHLARRDPWWLLALNVARGVLWVQPFLRLVRSRAMEAAELRCDELAARWTRSELALARCLAEVATWIERGPASHLAPGMAERSSALVERVERLLKPRRVSRTQGALVGLWLAAMLGGLGCKGPQVSPETTASGGDNATSANLGHVTSIQADPREPTAITEDTQAALVSSDEHADAHAEARQESQDAALEQLKGLGYVESTSLSREEQLATLDARIRREQEQLEKLQQQRERLEPDGLTSQTTTFQGSKGELVAHLDEEIAALKAEQAKLKPAHSKWKMLQQQIEALTAHRGQIAGKAKEDPVAARKQLETRVTRDLALKQQLDRLDAEIADKQEQLDAFFVGKDFDAKKVGQELEDLKAQRDQLLLAERVDAGESGAVDASGGSKLHVTTVQQGSVSMSTATRHVLRLHADGSVDCAGTQLVAPGSRDDAALVEHLEAIAAGMDRAPLDPARPDGPTLPDGTLKLVIDPKAPHSLFQRVLQACGSRDVQIWKFSLQLSSDAGDSFLGQPLPYALPRDLDEIPEAVEEGEEEQVRRSEVAIDLRLENAGEPRLLVYGIRWETTRDLPEPIQSFSFESSDPASLEETRTTLRKAHEIDPGMPVVIDARPGVYYAEVLDVVNAVVAAGFTDIRFVGLRQ